MSFTQGRTYLYRGSAFGFAAQFDHPSKATIPTQAMAVLAPTGGEAFSTVRNFDYQNIITFDEASAYAVGSEDPDGSHHSVATVAVRNFRFLNVIEADLVTMRVASVHRPRGEARDETIEEGEVTLTGSCIHGLRIACQPIDLTFRTELFAEHPTFDRFVKGGRDAGKCYAHGSAEKGLIVTSIVERVAGCQALSDDERKNLFNPRFALSGIRCSRNAVFVPGFGRIVIGEVIIERGYRRINMLRIELGCGNAGTGTVGGGEGNGAEIPPAT